MGTITAGLEGVIAGESEICYIDGYAGILSYRGYNIHTLAEHASFEEVIFLLWNGWLPKKDELAKLRKDLSAERGLPGGIVDFLGVGGRGGKNKDGSTPAPPAGTKGRYLDHIGFEVKDLDAFAKKLEADGVKFDMAPRDMTKQFGLKIAFITDPFGTYIELTEGLSKQ